MSCSKLSRSQSCCSLSRSGLKAESRVDQPSEYVLLLRPPSTDYITRTSVDDISGAVRIQRRFHEHPLVLSTYLKVHEDNVDDEFNSSCCCFCKLNFTVGVPIYTCVDCCYMSMHQSCGELPMWVHSTRHPQHELHLKVTTDRAESDGKERILTTAAYECAICNYSIGIKQALQSISISLFNNTYLNRPPKDQEGLSSSSIKATPTPYLSRSLSFPMEDKRKSQIIFSEPPSRDSRGISLTLSSFFNFQLACAENVDRIRHFSHGHPLVFMIFKMEYLSLLSIYSTNCLFCKDTIHPDDPIYGCHECDFYLHELCSKIPQTMRSTWHPAHMLRLMRDKYRKCQLCNWETFNTWKYGYGCDECAIYFHFECVSAYSFEDHKGQEHTSHFGKASIFTCDACGITETKEYISSVCTNCPIQVHKRCSYSFPRTVKQNRHHHKLNLTYSFEVDFDYANETCKICFNQMNKVYCMYQCADCCTYIAHVTCATSKYIVEDESVVDKIGELVITEVGEGQKVEHFSHAHPLVFTQEEPTKIDATYCDAGDDLIFTDEEQKVEAFCDACVSPISAPPFYACATDDECNFYLHKRCFELPLEIQHPLHEHHLTLISEKEFFKCYGCKVLCNGFKYFCAICVFNIDVRCSLLSDTLKHDGHECTLTLIDYKYVRDDEDTPKCSVCDGYWKSSCMFSCKICNFHIDLGCASLPKTVSHECPKHGWKAHPLQLTYGGIPDASGIYFCDTCEESRVLSHWFYDCDDCVWSNHPHCVLGRFQFKYGITYECECHDHDLQLVKKAPSRYDAISCGVCDEPLIHDSSLYCSICNLYFHIYCRQ